MDDTGSWFPVPEESELPGDLQKLFAKARERLGFVPNVFRVYAFRPQRLSAWFSHFRQLHEPSEHLGAADREMIAVVVSAANGCLYCLVAHGAALRDELGDPVLGERISYDWRRADLDARRSAICAYAEKLTLRPREVCPVSCKQMDEGRRVGQNRTCPPGLDEDTERIPPSFVHRVNVRAVVECAGHGGEIQGFAGPE